jgi:hypothetical protein
MVVGSLVLVVLMGSARSASAQVGYDPTKTVVVLGTVTADANGVASGTFDLPPGTTSGYECIAAGVDPGNQKLTELATVDSSGTALGSSHDLELASGTLHAVLASYAQSTVSGTIHVTAAGFNPFSPVTFSVRYTPAGTATSPGPVVTGGPLPLTGSDIGFLIAIAAAVLLVGTAFVTGGRAKRATVDTDR